MVTSSGLFLATIYNQSQLAERKHVACYWSINPAAMAVPLSAHPSPLVFTTKLAAAILGGLLFGGGVLPAQYCPSCASDSSSEGHESAGYPLFWDFRLFHGLFKDTPVKSTCTNRFTQQCNRFLTLTNNNIRSRVAAVSAYVSENEVKKQAQNFPNQTKHIPRLFEDFQGPPSFSSTFKALNLQHLNSSTFKDQVWSSWMLLHNDLGQAVHTFLPQLASSIIYY